MKRWQCVPAKTTSGKASGELKQSLSRNSRNKSCPAATATADCLVRHEMGLCAELSVLDTHPGV